MTYYSIDTGTGDQITTGLSELDARRVAKAEANRRGEPVYLYSSDDGPNDEAEEIWPE